MTRKRLFMTALIAAAGLLLVLVPGSGVYAAAGSDAKTAVCAGVGLTGSSCGDNGAQAENAIGAFVNILSIIIGIAAVLMIIVAGLRFITSSGDTSKVAGAKNSIIYALIGLVVVAIAQTIVHFVFAKATS